ncbi:MAG TPA: FAD-linked oxidase C-terminal domain-containing protein, partial [Pyrinomonadaceae bacterium]|nr:FAD-linked oxidase C-terminal domain-containing protein [Pyrinomonadaceae bacterium]
RARVSFAPRGAGTGLSGGALALDRGVVIELARMRRLLKVDVDNRLAVVETGMVNAKLSRAVAAHNLYYVPDPSSGAACTIGGNIAENAGGIHCLKYGTTTDHVVGARVVLSDGKIIELGSVGGAPQASRYGQPDYDLLGVFIGSEGTFGIATEATVKLLPLPAAVRTMLADFTDVDAASRAVSAIIAAGLLPAALEMVDGATIRAVEASVFAAGLPLDAQAALLIELDGLQAGLDAEAASVETLCREHGARNVRHAADEHERKKLWAARKGAFGAMGRLAPDMMIQDAVVPRSRLPEVLAATYRIAAKYRLRLANVFHAGDGNLHPFISFDRRDKDELLRVEAAGREIMEVCVRAGGTITGEHGVGLDKSAYLPLIFSPDDLAAMLQVRAAFDPSMLCNPGKIIPAPRGCGEARAVAATQSTPAATQATSVAAQSTQISSFDEEPQRRLAPAAELNINLTQKPSRSTSLALDGDAARRALADCVGDAYVSVEGESLVVAPANEAEACAVMRLAAANAWPVVPTGAALRLAHGRGSCPLRLNITTRRMTRLVEHEPADLVATAEAGLTLAAFNRQLAQSRQWLPLDPPDDERATLGGVAATGLGGAHAFAYGAPRAFVLGMRVLLADGRMIKAGGRVVKNVAGYDLCKLFTGSHGTLGLITELTFKLRPRPACEATLVARAHDQYALYTRARELLASGFLPVAVELLSTRFAAQLGLTEETVQDAVQYVSLIRFAGAEAAVSSQLERARALFAQDAAGISVEFISDDAALWRALAAAPLRVAHELRWRAQFKPSDLPHIFNPLLPSEHCHSVFSWHAGLGDGRLRVMQSVEGNEQSEAATLKEMRDRVEEEGGSFVIESAPEGIRREVMTRSCDETTGSLIRRVRQQLDPHGLFCPGFSV